MSSLLSLLLLLPSALCLPSFPQSPIHSILRRARLPDVIVPSICPSPCQRLFAAADANLTLPGRAEEEQPDCVCECPPEKPVYLHVMGYCVRGVDDCTSAIAVERDAAQSFEESYIPVVEFTPEGSRAVTKSRLTWSPYIHQWLGSALAAPSNSSIACSVVSAAIDSPLHRWTAYETPQLFAIADDEGAPQLLFSGSPSDAEELRGVVVQLKVDCVSEAVARVAGQQQETDVAVEPPLMCITFRVAGEFLVPHSPMDGISLHPEVVVLAIIAILLLIALCVSAVIYRVCWNIQKKKLVSDMQLQCMYHLKGPYRLPPGHGGQTPLSPSQLVIPHADELMRKPLQHAAQKRRLYFSSEYFDRENMLNPPPVADQFLFDLRRMIDLAKERIKARRHHPRLSIIPELPEPAEDEIGVDVEAVNLATTSMEPRSGHDESPRSGKSSDSGRDTLEDTPSCSSSSSSDSRSGSEKGSEGEEEERNETNSSSAEPRPLPRSSIPVRSATKPPVPPRPNISLIPTLTQASPRLPPRPLSSASVLPPLGEQPYGSPSGPSKRRHDRRRAYAVFPVDPMVNKSLPRRPRRTPPQQQASAAQ